MLYGWIDVSCPRLVASYTESSDLNAWLTSYSRIWDTSTGQCLRTLVYEDNPAAASVCFSPNGRFVLASYTDSCVRLWDFINMPCTVKKTYQGHINKDYSIGGCFGMLRSMRRVAVAAGDENNDPESEFQEEQWVESDSVAFVASASEDGAVVLWDVKTKEVLQRVEGAHQGICFWVDVHGETGTMVSCGQDGRVVVFRHRYPEMTPVGRENGQPNGHPDGEENGGKYPEELGGGRPRVEDVDEAMDMSEDVGDGLGETEPEPQPELVSDAVQTNGHREYTDGASNEGEAPAPAGEVDAAMDA